MGTGITLSGERWLPLWRDTLSLRGRRWEAAAGACAKGSMLDKALLSRGYTPGAPETEAYLAPTFTGMPSALSMKDADKALKRLFLAVTRREKVTVFGDYDVDGATSTAQMVRYLASVGTPVDFYIPDRMREGYGPNAAALEKIARDGTRLVVCVDSGTTALGALAAGVQAGLDIIVIDHHAQGHELPEVTAVVNPNRRDDTSGLGHMCAAGVVWMILRGLDALLRRKGWPERAGVTPYPVENLLALTGLGTVADVVPLQGVNRAIVHHGLRVAGELTVPGIHAMSMLSGKSPPFEAWHHGFVFGPRINAAGRISDSSLGARMLISEDWEEARTIAARLEDLNEERRHMCRVAEDQAVAMVEEIIQRERRAGANDPAPPPAIVLANPDWHPGIIGIVAGRIKERYDRPTFVLSVDEEKGIAKGSGRSVVGFDLGQAVHQAIDDGLLVAGGGHPMAAGITLEAARIEDFTRFLCDACYDLGPVRSRIDIIARPGDITMQDIQALQRMAPFGQGNREPMIALVGATVIEAKPMKNEAHLLMTLGGPRGRMKAKMFSAGGTPVGDALFGAQGAEIDIAGFVEINEFPEGKFNVEMRIMDAIIRKPATISAVRPANL